MNPAELPLPSYLLSEWQSLLIEDATLTVADQRLKAELESGEEGRLVIDELRVGVRITARSWVGVVRFERFEVRVIPKLGGDNLGLVEMIELATGLDALRRSSSARDLDAQDVGLLDLVALLFAESVEALLRAGALADYVEREDELPVVRGRLLSDVQMLRRFGQIDRLACRFDDHVQDIPDNQLLAAALSRCAPRVTHEGVRRRIRRALAIFDEICQADELDLANLRVRMSYHRLNDHYRDPHGLAWLLLDGLGTKDLLVSGHTRCFAFLIDMNRLFEQFVFRAVERLFAGSSVGVHYQRGDASIIVNTATNKPYSRVVPDLLVEDRSATPIARLAIDAKYKLYDQKKLASGDVYQGFLYAYAYGLPDGSMLPSAILVYPSSTRAIQAVSLGVHSAKSLLGAEILALGIPVRGLLDELVKGHVGPVGSAIRQAIHRGLGRTTMAVA